jgi:hypothetical protein
MSATPTSVGIRAVALDRGVGVDDALQRHALGCLAMNSTSSGFSSGCDSAPFGR